MVLSYVRIGKRMNSSIPKQYLLINNISLLEINIEKFFSLPYLSYLIVISKNISNFIKILKINIKMFFLLKVENLVKNQPLML